MDSRININALNISPYLWWKYIDKAMNFANHFSKELFDYDFEKWLKSEFSSERRVFDEETWGGFMTNSSYSSIDDYIKIGKKNSVGTLMSFNTESEVNSNPSLSKDAPLIYTYSVTSLHHLCFSFFNLWLIYDTEEYFYKWQSYFSFIGANTTTERADIYKNFWFWVLLEIDRHEKFDDVSQYKKFVHFLHDCEKETDYLEKQWIEKRDALKKNV